MEDGIFNMLDEINQDLPSKDNSVIKILSANVNAARAKAPTLARWEADITLLQETKLFAGAILEVRSKVASMYKHFIHGKPGTPIEKMSNVYGSAVHDSAQGGVAVAITKPRSPIKQAPSLLASERRSTGRWEEVFVPATKSTSHLAVANIYKVAKASNDNRSYKENEAHTRQRQFAA